MAGPSMTQKRKLANATGARVAAKRAKPATESTRVSSLPEVTKSPRKNQLLKFGGTQEPDVGDAFINPTAMSYFAEVKVSAPFLQCLIVVIPGLLHCGSHFLGELLSVGTGMQT